MAAAYRRKIFLVNKPFQVRYSFYVCSWLFAFSLVFPLIIYNLFDFFITNVFPAPTTGSVAALDQVRMEIVQLLVLLEVVFLTVTFLISLFVSHRIAGPLEKLKLFFKKTEEGNLLDKLSFRKSDHFKDLAEDYNQMIDGLRKKIVQERQETSTALSRLEEVAGSLQGDDQKKINEIIGKLKKTQTQITV